MYQQLTTVARAARINLPSAGALAMIDFPGGCLLLACIITALPELTDCLARLVFVLNQIEYHSSSIAAQRGTFIYSQTIQGKSCTIAGVEIAPDGGIAQFFAQGTRHIAPVRQTDAT